jgi:hypothetical protein
MKRYAAIATFLLLTLPAVGQKKQKKNADNVPPPVAQSGPSFEVTRGWLISTLTDYSGSFDFEDRYSNFQISNACILTFHLGHIPTGDKKEFKDLSGEITIPLGALTEIEGVLNSPDDQRIDFKTGNTAAILDSIPQQTAPAYDQYSIDIQHTPKNQPGQPLTVSDAEMIPRLVTAFQHMREICEGTYQSPSAPKSPF